MTHRLEIVDLTCARGDRPLFEGLCGQLGGGELLHVAGSNGSGKTTLLRTLCGLSRPAIGEIRWGGKSIRTLGDEYRRSLAYVGHFDGIQGELTPIENLSAYRCVAGDSALSGVAPSISGIPAAAMEIVLERMDLAAYRSFPSKILSQGQRRRLALARLLMADKPLWILDEPFTALDVRSCRLVVELLDTHLAAGGLIALSSHQNFEMPRGVYRQVDLDGIRHSSNPDDMARPRAEARVSESVAGRSPA